MANLNECQLVNEWKGEAQAECVLQVLEERFGKVPLDVHVRVSRVVHRPTLRGWLSIAVKCKDLDDFRHRSISLAEVIECQFGRVPLDILARIGQVSDELTIQEWITAAMNAKSLDEFRTAIGLIA